MMRMRRFLLAVLIGVGLGSLLMGRLGYENKTTQEAGDAVPSNVPAITVHDAWVRATVGSGGMTGAFMTIENVGGTADRLLGAAVDAEVAGAVEIHETTIGDDQVMRMRPVEGIDVPAGGRVELKPGSYHIMLLDVQRDLTPEESLTLTLTFESGAQVAVSASVRAME
jgi:periplasmic copper chaperone A